MNTLQVIGILWMLVGIITVGYEKIKSIIKKEPLEINSISEGLAIFAFLFFGPAMWLYVGLANLYWWRTGYLTNKRRNKTYKSKKGYTYPKRND